MRAVVQRVSESSVAVDGEVTGAIGPGLLVLLGVGAGDRAADADYLVDKIAGLRIFCDDEGKMNRSVEETGGEILLISQFTLHGDCRRGRRPSFTAAARPETAIPLYERMAAGFRARGLTVATGVFGAHMQVSLVNDGPVTILIDSEKGF
ncbi:MAG: D-tyrosyl-tRNA(Tyr) deacylase [Candidatus Hydrogenedens sp.]|nr:D-tyrosyl-tRNA(Tyr) deacylase [Candidatus Hydrogenedentota bacterium]NLF57167.1 D-tyrosyl-tRNA(Tyr) deacylase [Candidatus Hydrogenedens sp.]